MRSFLLIRLLPALLLPGLAGTAAAQYVPPFSQSFVYPTGHSTTSTYPYNTSMLDTSVTFQPLAPPDDDYGVAPITTIFHFSGQTLHWQLKMDLTGPLFRFHSYSPTNQCNAVFRLYGVPLGDTAFVKVQVISFVAINGGSNGLGRGRVVLATNMGTATHEFTHYYGNPPPTTDTDTLIVPARVLGNDQYLTFQLSMLNHVEMLDSSSPNQDVTADVSFLDVPQGTSIVNAYGYGSVVLGAPSEDVRVGVLRARAHADGRRVMLAGVAPGAAELALFDLAGRRLVTARTTAPPSGDAGVTLESPLTSGIYFVRCTDARGVRSTRFAFAR
jgi:hypothetical protein